MNVSRRVAAVLSGLAMAGAISTGPALAATGEAPLGRLHTGADDQPFAGILRPLGGR